MSNQFYYGQLDYIQKLNELYDLYTSAQLLHLAPVATSGSYVDLTSKPVIPTVNSQLLNDSSYITALGAPVQSVAGKTGAVALVKADVGLGSVDNTSDVNKPISTAQQTALDGKVNTTDVVNAAHGGTGQVSYAIGDLLYADTTSSLSKLAGVATGNALISGGVGTAPSYGKVGLTTHVSGTLPVANGGTGAPTLTGYVKGAGTAAFSASTSIPGSDISGDIAGNAGNISGVAAAANGGTGQSAYAVGDILYASTTSALSKLADVAAGNVIISGGVGVAPAYGKVGLTTHVTGTLPVANGGTGGTDITTARTNLSVYSKAEVDSAISSSSGAVTSWNTRTGAVTLLTSDVTGVLATGLPVANGGTGAVSLTGYVKGNGTAAMTASATVPGSDVSGNITGNAANVTGTVAVANGGTGATDVATARTNLLVYSKSETDALPFGAARAGLTNYIYPSTDRMWRDVYAGGWRPAFMNQQWGGAQWGAEMIDSATGNLLKFDVATGNVQDDAIASIYTSAANQYQSQRLIVSESGAYTQFMLKMYKGGNPTDNIIVKVYDATGSGGVPGAQVGTGSATLSAKLITSKTDGEWYLFTLNAAANLTANTAYWLRLERSGVADAANCANVKTAAAGSGKYPFQLASTFSGYRWDGAAWNTNSGGMCFIVLNPDSNSFFQSGGQFDGKLVFAEGTPLNQSRVLINQLKNFFDPKEATLLHRVSSCVKGKPIADYLYGLDHDRILLMCDATTGYASVRLYKQDGTLLTVTGNTDVSGTTMSGIAINFRAVGDGADYLKLTVNGTQQAALTAQTITFDPLMRELGHAWLGGGFAAAPTWTQKLDMSSLPSANGFTWAGTGVEANCMIVSGGKLYQNKNGYGATDTGYYTKTPTGASNATGMAMTSKMRVPSNTNTNAVQNAIINMGDGTRIFQLMVQEYFANAASGGPTNLGTIQYDAKSYENVALISTKGNDSFAFINGRLVYDATAANTATGATQVNFGDSSATSGETADAVYDYVAYYTGGAILPQISTGMSLHEYAHWSGDKSSYLVSLYNGGTPISVKKFTGMPRNYVKYVMEAISKVGITSSPTTSATTYTLIPELECYVVGDSFEAGTFTRGSNSTASATQYIAQYLDGANPAASRTSANSAIANAETPLSMSGVIHKTSFGMHKVETRAQVSAGTLTMNITDRRLTVKGA